MGNTIIKMTDGVIRQQKNTILKGVNVEIGEGEFVYLIGKVGSGKSSFLKTLYAELPLEYGTAEVAGFQLKKLRKSQVPMLRRKCGIVFQDFKLLIDRSVYKNLEFVLQATGWRDKKAIRERIATVLDMVDMSNKQDKMPHQLSGGEQQRIVLARALLNAPPLILADEPTGNIDPETSYHLVELLKEICQTGKTVIIATHQYDLIERYPGRVLCCEEGRMYEKPMPGYCGCTEKAQEEILLPAPTPEAEAICMEPEPTEETPEVPETMPAEEPNGMVNVGGEEPETVPEEQPAQPETAAVEAPVQPETVPAEAPAQREEKEEVPPEKGEPMEEEEDILALIGKLDYPEITAFDYELEHLPEIWIEEEKALTAEMEKAARTETAAVPESAEATTSVPQETHWTEESTPEQAPQAEPEREPEREPIQEAPERVTPPAEVSPESESLREETQQTEPAEEAQGTQQTAAAPEKTPEKEEEYPLPEEEEKKAAQPLTMDLELID